MPGADNGAGDATGHNSADKPRVVICGAGVIGASVAYYLSLRGIAATLIERTAVACAASGKAGGFLALDWSDGSPLGPLARRSFGLHEQLGAQFGERTGYRRVSTWAVKTAAGGSKQAPAAKGLPAWLDGGVATARRMAGGDTTAQVHPEQLTKALLEAAAAKAGTVVRIGRVEGLRFGEGGRVMGVAVDGQTVPADVAVLAMGPWTKAAAAWAEGVPLISGQKAHSVVLKPTAEVSADCLFLDHRSKTGRQADPECYPRPDGSVYICGESESVDPPADPAAIEPRAAATASLQEVGAAISSALAGAELLQAQACFLPLSPDGVPAIGPLPGTADSLYVASGHSCWGILNAPATGEAIAAMIAGERPPVDMATFSPARFASGRRVRARARS